MKRYIASIALSLGAVAPICHAAGWVDSWFDSATYSGPGNFSTQNRHFMTGGSFAVRSQVKTDYPITLALPKISAGCGGIDGFMGGFSFLDADYLVDKAQRMMQAAPYIAVDMALKTMSKEFSDTIKAAEDIITALNSIQLNECQSMKPIVTAALDRNVEGMKSAMGEIVNAKQIRESSSRLWQEAREAISDNNDKAPVDLSEEVAGCPADVRNIFDGGSVIEKVADESGMGDHADLIRGYFGDVFIEKTNNVILARPISPCPENQENHEGFLFGDSFERDATTLACTRTTGKTVHEAIHEKITAIASKIENNQPLSSDDMAFAGQGSRLPVFKMLQVAYDDGTLDATIPILTDITAASYAARIADTFYFSTYDILKRIAAATDNPTQEDNNKPCNMTLFAGAASQIRNMLGEVREARKHMMNNLTMTINEHTQFQAIVDEARRRMGENKRREARQLGALE